MRRALLVVTVFGVLGLGGGCKKREPLIMTAMTNDAGYHYRELRIDAPVGAEIDVQGMKLKLDAPSYSRKMHDVEFPPELGELTVTATLGKWRATETVKLNPPNVYVLALETDSNEKRPYLRLGPSTPRVDGGVRADGAKGLATVHASPGAKVTVAGTSVTASADGTAPLSVDLTPLLATATCKPKGGALHCAGPVPITVETVKDSLYGAKTMSATPSIELDAAVVAALLGAKDAPVTFPGDPPAPAKPSGALVQNGSGIGSITRPSDIGLVVFMDDQNVRYESCGTFEHTKTKETAEIQMRIADVHAVAIDRRTAKKVAERTWRGKRSTCPDTVSFKGKTVEGDVAWGSLDLQAWVRQLLAAR